MRCLVYHSTLAPSTHINIFLNLQLFLSGYLQLFISGLQNFLSTSSVFKLNLPGIWIHSGEIRPTCCLAILVYCLVREWTRFWLVIGLKNIWVCCSHVIALVADLFFPLCRAGSKICGFGNEFASCVWTGGISRKKKLRIKNYSNVCGRGHNSA